MAKSIKEIDSQIQWLSSNPNNRFEIYDLDQEKVIDKCISYQDLIEDYSTPIQYFERLADSGIKTVQIVKKRKNGSSFVGRTCGLNFALSIKDNVAASGSMALPAATPQQLKPSNVGLMGAANNFGLGAPEILEMRSQADRYKELKETFSEIKKRNEDLEKENRKLENENLRHQLGVDSKPSAVDKLVEGIASNPAALPQIIAAFKGGASTPGLNAPEPQHQLSDTKSMVVDLISNNKQVSDDLVQASYYVLIEALKGNQQFLNEYQKLLINHKIIENGSDNNSYS